MKRILLLLIFIAVYNQLTLSQTEAPASKPIVEIFTDFHAKIGNGDPKASTGFSINRAYLGYNFAIDKNFSAVVILNIGSPDELASGSKARRYSYFREASMNYTNNRLTLSMGVLKTKVFMFQGTFWNMRYLAKPFQELYGYGLESDLGFEATYKFNDKIEADLSLLNGEGGGNLQLDNRISSAVGITFKPGEKFAFRIYDDWMNNKGVWQNTSVIFAGYRSDKFFLGADFNYKTNLDTISGHNAWGISATGGVNLSEKVMFFTRYDLAKSVVAQGDSINWNYEKNGSFIITGFQYTVTKSVRIALNYRLLIPDDKSKISTNMIYLNLVLKI